MSQNQQSTQAQRGIASLIAILEEDQENLDNINRQLSQNSDSDEESIEESPCPILDRYLEETGNESIKKITGFYYQEIGMIYDPIELDVSSKWLDGRGKKPEVTPKDAFFMMLTVFKAYSTWDIHAEAFGMHYTTFQKTVMKILKIVTPLLAANHIHKPDMEKLDSNKQTFVNFPYALYATDVKFQQSYRPRVSHEEAKVYFSGKHKLYGLKVEFSVTPDGQCVDFTKHYPGSVHDLTICRKNKNAHKTMLRKKTHEHTMEDDGELYNEYKNYWAMIVDMGYIGLKHELRAIHPTKKPAKGRLPRQEKIRNKEVSSDRSLIERYFGRMNLLWGIMAKQYRWAEEIYDSVVTICVALTNFHITLNPLNVQDEEYYKTIMAKLRAIAKHMYKKRKDCQKKYRQRQKLHRQMMENEIPIRPNYSEDEQEDMEEAAEDDGSQASQVLLENDE